MNRAALREPGRELDPQFSGVEVDVTAGGAGDATEVDGAYFLRGSSRGVMVMFSFTTALGSAEQVTIACNLQDADDTSGTGVADFGTAVAATVIATGPGGGGTVTGVAVAFFDVDLAREALRVQWTPDISTSGTDTAKITAMAALGAGYLVPAAGVIALN